jgi:predicted transcriptional regulator
MKEKIMQLRSQGRSYKQIVDEIGCSKSLVSYYCSLNGATRTRKIQDRRREENPGLHAVEHFLRKKIKPHRIKQYPPSLKDIREKVRAFQRRNGSKLLNKSAATFTYYQMLDTYKDNQICYLTGRQIDLMNTNTYSLDHIRPATRGGTNLFDNMGIACPQANWGKSDMTVEEFVQLCSEVVEHFGGRFEKRPCVPMCYRLEKT